MAVIWQKKANGKTYEVRSAGRTRRLYTNGVCHSEFNPDRVFSGSIWDILSIPALFHSPTMIRRVLMLGTGGGAVVRQLCSLLSPELIVGVELEPIHLYIARRFFAVEQECVELVQADAVDWLQRYDGEGFDLIIEDLYSETGNEPSRVVAVDREWFNLLKRRLSSRGKLVINFISRAELLGSAYFNQAGARSGIASAFQLTVPQLDNYVGVFLRQPGDSSALRANLQANRDSARAIGERRLSYRIRELTYA